MSDIQHLTGNFASCNYRYADKSLAGLRRKQATATEVLILIYLIYFHNLMNINTIYIYI